MRSQKNCCDSNREDKKSHNNCHHTAKKCPKTKKPHYIIVGAGTSSSLLARFLTDNFNIRVLVFEKGVNHNGDPIVEGGLIPLISGKASTLTYDKKYSTTALVPDDFNAAKTGEFKKYESYSSGIGSGGSSAHNYLLTVRGGDEIYDQWGVASGRPDLWSSPALLSIQKGLEKFFGVSQLSQERGFNGNLNITQLAPAPFFEPAAVALSGVINSPVLDDYNVSNGNLAVSSAQLNVFPNTLGRSYGFNAYLPPSILDNEGLGVDGRQLIIKFERTVTRILFENLRAVGVEVVNKKGKKKCFYAKRKIIVSAGAPFSSYLLQHSGIGNASILAPLGIKVLVNNPNVGNKLKVHYGIKYAMRGELFVQNIIVGFAQANNPVATRKLQIIIQQNQGLTQNLKTVLNIAPTNLYIGGDMWNLRPRVIGTSYIVDSNPVNYPNILYKLYQDGDQNDPLSDLSTSIAAYRIAKNLADALNTELLWPPPSVFEEPGSNDRLALAALGDTDNAITNHYSGTCNMGTNITNGVVDGTLHVFGVEDLMVVDSSIEPFIPTGNTGMPAYYVGAVGAKILGATVPQN